MRKHLVRLITLLLVIVGGTAQSATSQAAHGNTSSNETPVCHLRANPNEINIGGGTTLIWWSTGGVIESKLYPKGSNHLIKTFSGGNGWHWISGIIDTREYTLVVKNANGEKAECDAKIIVRTANDNDDDNQKNNSTNKEEIHKHKKHHHHNSRKYKRHKKYRGSTNKKIYRKIKYWKKHNHAKYLQYKAVYKKYRGIIPHKKLKKELNVDEYKIYREYRIYHEYKEYRHSK